MLSYRRKQNDCLGYLQTVENALRFYNPECADNLKLAFDKVHELFTTVEGRAELNQKVAVVPPFDSNPIDVFSAYTFFSSLVDPLMVCVIEFKRW